MSRSTADPATYAPAQPRSAWKTALTIGAAYMLIAATLTHLVVTAFVMLAMGVDDWTWSRSEGPHPFSRSLMMWFVGGLVLVGSLMSRAEIPHWRKLLRPMLWAALYAFLAGLIVFLLQLDFVNRRAGGWLDLPATQILWVTRSYGSYPPLGPPQYANPVLLWSAICALLFGAIGYARAAGWPALREVLRSWPRRLVQPFEHADLATAGWFLWGVAIGLLLGRALVPRVALVVGIVLLIYAPSAASRVLAGLMRFIVAIIDAATRRFRGRPFGDVAADAAGFSVALTGAAIVLILDKSLGTDRLAVIAAIALSGAAVLWRRGVHARGQMTMCVLGFFMLWLLAGVDVLRADDGTWSDGSMRDLANTGGGPESIDNARDLATPASTTTNGGGFIGENEGSEDAPPADAANDDEIVDIAVEDINRSLGLDLPEDAGTGPAPPIAGPGPDVTPPPGPEADGLPLPPSSSATDDAGLPLDIVRPDGTRVTPPAAPPTSTP